MSVLEGLVVVEQTVSAAWLVSEEALKLIAAYFNGFAISLALILAIGAQNAFVLRQGLLKQYIFPVVMFPKKKT